jgi:hypothetical protein
LADFVQSKDGLMAQEMLDGICLSASKDREVSLAAMK